MSLNNGFPITLLANTSTTGAVVTQLTTAPTLLCMVAGFNNSPGQRFVKFFDTVSFTSGLSPSMVIGLPGNSAGAGSNISPGAATPMYTGAQFTNGLAVAITLNQAIADISGVSGLNDCMVTIGYRT